MRARPDTCLKSIVVVCSYSCKFRSTKGELFFNANIKFKASLNPPAVTLDGHENASRATFQNHSHEEVRKYHVIVVREERESRVAYYVTEPRSCLDLDEPESSNRSERAVAS